MSTLPSTDSLTCSTVPGTQQALNKDWLREQTPLTCLISKLVLLWHAATQAQFADPVSFAYTLNLFCVYGLEMILVMQTEGKNILFIYT